MALYHSARGVEDYTIVGSPTIVDGAVSGFSETSYLSLPSIPFGTANTWEFQVGFHIPNTVTGTGYVVGNYSSGAGIRVYISDNGYVYVLPTVPGQKRFAYNIGSDYIVKVTFDGSQYSYDYCENNGEWVNIETVVSTEKNGTSNTATIIGNTQAASKAYPFLGTIDLKNTYIKIDGQPWFGICPIEVKKHQLMGPVGYTVVGSPTITDGVASGFSSSKFLKIDNQLDTTKPFELVVKFNLSSNNVLQSALGVDISGIFNLLVRANSHLRFSTGTAKNVFDIAEIEGSALSTNIDYWAKAIFTGAKYELYLSTDGTTWNKEGEQVSSVYVNNGSPISLQIGNSHAQNWYFRGSIDLNGTYIKSNSKLWFWQPRETERIVVNGVEVWTKPGAQ